MCLCHVCRPNARWLLYRRVKRLDGFKWSASWSEFPFLSARTSRCSWFWFPCLTVQSKKAQIYTLFFLLCILPCLFSTAGHPLQLHSFSVSHSSFSRSPGHPIHLFFIKLQHSPRLISCGYWWSREHAGSFPETGRGREWCRRSKDGGWFGLRWWKKEGSSFWECPVTMEFIRRLTLFCYSVVGLNKHLNWFSKPNTINCKQMITLTWKISYRNGTPQTGIFVPSYKNQSSAGTRCCTVTYM